MGVWKQHTYLSGLKYCYMIKGDKTAYTLTLKVLKMQGLEDKYMDGYSVQNIPIKNEGKIDIIFTNIFWNLAGDYITPVYYVASIVKKCLENKIDDPEQVAGIVGRGLRSLPSFLREMDLAYKLSKLFPNAEISNGPEQDVGEHTDILIKTGSREYRVWSYQDTNRGLDNTAARFCGRRGELPKGYHILCPINISDKAKVKEVNGWCFYSESYVKDIYEMISVKKPDEYQMLAGLQTCAIKQYLKEVNIVYK